MSIDGLYINRSTASTGDLLVDWGDHPEDSDIEEEAEEEARYLKLKSFASVHSETHTTDSEDSSELEEQDDAVDSEMWKGYSRLSMNKISEGLLMSTGSAVLDKMKEATKNKASLCMHDSSVKTWRKSIRKSICKMQHHLEVFEPGYRATQRQNETIAKLENQLLPDGVVRRAMRRRSSGSSLKNLRGVELAQVVLHSHAMVDENQAHQFIKLFGQTVILKKSPVTYHLPIEETSTSNLLNRFSSSERLDIRNYEEPRELMLFNNSILIACLENNAALKNNSKDVWNRLLTSIPVNKYVFACEPLFLIKQIVDLSVSCYSHETDMELDDNDGLVDLGFRIVFPDKSYTFECAIEDDKRAWMKGLALAVLESKKNRSLQRQFSECHDDDKERSAMFKYETVRQCIFSAVVSGDEKMLLRVIRKKQYSKQALDRLDVCGYSPCHYAVFKERLGCLEILLNSGADPNNRDKFDKTPGEYARTQEVIDLLAVKGADKELLPTISKF